MVDNSADVWVTSHLSIRWFGTDSGARAISVSPLFEKNNDNAPYIHKTGEK